MGEYVRICENMWEYVGICGNMWEYVRICENICEYLRICENMWEYVRICENMWKYVRICENMWEYVRICENMWEYVRICENMSSESQKLFCCRHPGIHGNLSSLVLDRIEPTTSGITVSNPDQLSHACTWGQYVYLSKYTCVSIDTHVYRQNDDYWFALVTSKTGKCRSMSISGIMSSW